MDLSGINSVSIQRMMTEALRSIGSANAKLVKATEEIADGDIVEAALLISQSRIEARSGAAVAKVAAEIGDSILDILA